MHLDELSSLLRLGRRTKVDSSSRRIVRLLLVFTLILRKNICPSSLQTNYASFMVRPVLH